MMKMALGCGLLRSRAGSWPTCSQPSNDASPAITATSASRPGRARLGTLRLPARRANTYGDWIPDEDDGGVSYLPEPPSAAKPQAGSVVPLRRGRAG